MASIHQATTEEDRAHVQELFWEYLEWANARVSEEFSVNFDIETMLEQDMEKLDIYFPPDGRLMLAMEASNPAGLACLKKLKKDIAEMKRMYVRPAFRDRGIGRALLERLLAEAKEIGYHAIRLDSARFMREAHAMYRSVGFNEIEPYAESEIPPEFRKHWVFMERQL